MGQTDGEKGVNRLGSDNAKVNRKTEDRICVLNGTIVGVFSVRKLSIGSKVGANISVLAGLVGKVGCVLCSPVPVTVVGLIAGF